MAIARSQRPGRHERHLLRRLHNPLFPRPLTELDDETLLEAQRQDHEELLAFITELRATVQKAATLPPNAETQVILDLKTELDRLYEASAGLADEQADNQAAIAQLTAVMMRTIRAAAAGDPLAEQQLADEDEARAQHYALLREPLVADLLHPESLIGADELVPALLSAPAASLSAVLTLFDSAQWQAMVAQAEALLTGIDGVNVGDLAGARQRLSQMQAYLAASPLVESPVLM